MLVRVRLYSTPSNQGSFRSSAAVARSAGFSCKHRPIKSSVASASSSEISIFSSTKRALIGKSMSVGFFLSSPEEIKRMSTGEDTAQRRIVTVCVEILRSLRRDLELLSAEGVSAGIQHHLIKHVLRLVQTEFCIRMVTEEVI